MKVSSVPIIPCEIAYQQLTAAESVVAGFAAKSNRVPFSEAAIHKLERSICVYTQYFVVTVLFADHAYCWFPEFVGSVGRGHM